MGDALGLPGLENGCVATVGTFDGVHRGHRDILSCVTGRAREVALPPVVITFRPHPLEVVNPPAAPLLLTPLDEQLEALAESGMRYVIALPFTRNLAAHSADAFVRHLLIDRYRITDLVIGYDHGLGRGRQGDTAALAAMGRRLGFQVQIVPPTLDPAGIPISSSSIRGLVAHGDLVNAARALGRPYRLRGRVVKGAQRGRGIGFPTLNIELPTPRKLLPPDGVYAVRVAARQGEFGGMMNLGSRPTFGEMSRAVEVHLFDADGDWYGNVVTVELVKRLRDVVRFDGLEALKTQLNRDRESARLALTQA